MAGTLYNTKESLFLAPADRRWQGKAGDEGMLVCWRSEQSRVAAGDQKQRQGAQGDRELSKSSFMSLTLVHVLGWVVKSAGAAMAWNHIRQNSVSVLAVCIKSLY